MADDIPNPVKHPTTAEQAAGGEDRIRAALAYLRRGLPRDGRSSGESSFAREEACLAEWAESMGLLLNPEDLPSKAVKGGQEHDLWHEETTDRYWKLINMPFDVIPCLPEGGFLDFIRDTLAAGHSLRAVRTTRSHTTP